MASIRRTMKRRNQREHFSFRRKMAELKAKTARKRRAEEAAARAKAKAEAKALKQAA